MIRPTQRPRVGCARLIVAIGVITLLAGACTGETATPVDLDADPTTTSTSGAAPGDDDATTDDPNAGERERVRQLAEQQCLDDPDKVEGVIRIVDPVTDQVVSEIVVDCAVVRAARE